MSKKEDCAIFQDLYELYTEGETEEQTNQWMKEHERSCNQCIKGRGIEMAIMPLEEDYKKMKSIKILTALMYSLFIVLSIWMSMWYFW